MSAKPPTSAAQTIGQLTLVALQDRTLVLPHAGLSVSVPVTTADSRHVIQVTVTTANSESDELFATPIQEFMKRHELKRVTHTKIQNIILAQGIMTLGGLSRQAASSLCFVKTAGIRTVKAIEQLLKTVDLALDTKKSIGQQELKVVTGLLQEHTISRKSEPGVKMPLDGLLRQTETQIVQLYSWNTCTYSAFQPTTLFDNMGLHFVSVMKRHGIEFTV